MVLIINWVKFNVDACWKVGVERSLVGIVDRDSALVCITVRSLEVLASNAAISKALAVLEGCLGGGD